ncbi:Immunoglobulin V-set domain [Trinorchestia longiramus]|nr:Immunoglobulin V-set domain [Trinorchestia longiramus]
MPSLSTTSIHLSKSCLPPVICLLLISCARLSVAITAFGIEGGLSREQPPPRPEQIWDNPLMRPAFGETPTLVSTPVGRVAYLHCKVNHLGSRVVTWIRKRDSHVLTVGLFSYTSDQRFTALHAEGSSDWLLKITSPQTRDSGIYECQVSTEPKISKAFTLRVIESRAVLDGPSNRHMSAGTTLNLSCWASGAAEQPTYFYWSESKSFISFVVRALFSNSFVLRMTDVPDALFFNNGYHNDEVIRYTSGGDLRYRVPVQERTSNDGSADAVTVWGTEAVEDYTESEGIAYGGGKEGGLQSVSLLVVEHLSSVHSGNYTCAPENSAPSTVTVYVLRAGEQPAAMQHGGSRSAAQHCSLVLQLLQLLQVLQLLQAVSVPLMQLFR